MCKKLCFKYKRYVISLYGYPYIRVNQQNKIIMENKIYTKGEYQICKVGIRYVVYKNGKMECSSMDKDYLIKMVEGFVKEGVLQNEKK